MAIEIYIGPNGFGKTTKLNSIKKTLIEGVAGGPAISADNILFLDSEILLLDEMKDTKDDSKTMEYVIFELLSTAAVNSAKVQYEQAIDSEITANIHNVNLIVDDILNINNNTRNITTGRGAAQVTSPKDFLEVTSKKEHKKLVKINSAELVTGKMGSGQRMQLILALIRNSTKTHIFLDEPEKYSHPSMLHRTARLIQDIATTKQVYLATHSPKLLSMLDFDFSNLYVINDTTHAPKSLDFAGAIALYSAHSTIISTIAACRKSFSYFTESTLKSNIKNLHYREFIEAMFSNDVYLVEGVNDSLFIKKMLLDNGKLYEDYFILPTYGKQHMMLFANLLESIGITVHLYFDEDNALAPEHLSANRILSSFTHHYMFSPKIENAIGYTGQKSNTVLFITYLDTYTISNTFLC